MISADTSLRTLHGDLAAARRADINPLNLLRELILAGVVQHLLDFAMFLHVGLGVKDNLVLSE